MQKIDPASKSISNTVDQAVGPEQITDKFLTKYEKLFNSVTTSNPEIEKLQNVLANNISFNTRIAPDIVRFCVGKLKPHKDDGKYGFKSDHLINGTNKLFTVLSIMFNAMLTHGFNPDDLLQSTIISIPKDSRGSMCSSDNYRGISLSNSICKLFDYVFIHTHKDSLQTCDLQFGFKTNHSTVLCTAIYMETINHYVNEGSNVYSCLLDANKAFDRVHGGILFKIIIERKVSFLFIRLLLDSYLRQLSCVAWGFFKSRYFSLSNAPFPYRCRITSGTIRRVNRVAAVMVRGDPCWSWNVREGPWGSGRPTRQFWEVQNCRVRPGRWRHPGWSVQPPCRVRGQP